jgi:hypothetical protein
MLNAYRVRAWTLLALGILVALPFCATGQQTNSEVNYFVLGEKYPKGLGDFQAFGLFRKETSGGKVKLDGWVMTSREAPDNSSFDIKTIRLEGKHLAFTTVSHEGLVFTFDGQFLRSGDFKPYFNKEIPVVEGTVRKFRKGKKVAEAKMRFTCGIGG